jgi:lantibiotic modifying enzyme
MTRSPFILQTIETIQNNITKKIRENSDIGILTGLSGYSVFLEYYSKFISNKPQEIDSEYILNLCIDKINNNYKTSTYCDGVCGLIWSLHFLHKNDFIGAVDNIDILDDYVREWTYLSIDQHNFDFLHGSTGSMYNFIYQPTDIADQDTLPDRYIQGLQNRYSEISDYKLLRKEQPFEHRTYLGVAHGVTGYIYILSLLSAIPRLKNTCLELLDKYFELLLEVASFSENNRSVFPSWLLQTTNLEKESSGLSWCLGDLGIGIVLLNSSLIIGNKEMERIALKILNHSSKRITRETTGLTSPSLCHGYFGAYKIFSRAYSVTGEKNFLNAKNHWLNAGLENIKNSIPSDTSILIGQTGIGLALIDAYTDTDHNWGECLLIS